MVSLVILKETEEKLVYPEMRNFLQVAGSIPIFFTPTWLDVAKQLGISDPDYVIFVGGSFERPAFGVNQDSLYTIREAHVQGRPRKVLVLPNELLDVKMATEALQRLSELLANDIDREVL